MINFSVLAAVSVSGRGPFDRCGNRLRQRTAAHDYSTSMLSQVRTSFSDR